MSNQLRDYHKLLLSGPSLTLGKIHWRFLQSTKIITHLSCSGNCNKNLFFTKSSNVLTDFGNEIYSREIHWWVYQKEIDHKELLSRTEILSTNLLNMRDAIKVFLKNTPQPESYFDLIQIIKDFLDNHQKKIEVLNDYVEWLANKNPIAPCILFSRETWGSQLLAERFIEINDDQDPDEGTLLQCIEIALGLKDSYSNKILCIAPDPALVHHSDWLDNWLKPQDKPIIPKPESPPIDGISRSVFGDLLGYFDLLWNSSRKIVHEIYHFFEERLPVIRTLDFGKREKDVIRFCIAQIEYSLTPVAGSFGFVPENESLLKDKIFSAIRIAQENNVNLICFPELSFKKDWLDELLPLSVNLIIICGSYYEDSYNVCPVIISGHIVDPRYKKYKPSPSELGVVLEKGMKSGNIVYIYNTDFGRFSTLTCIDYSELSHIIISHTNRDLDFIVNPCYDDNIKRFQAQCNSDCENHDLTIIQVNRADTPDGKYGKSCIISKEHRTIIDCFTSGHYRDSDDQKYLLVKVRNEGLVIADIDFRTKAPPVPLPLSYRGRIKITRSYQYISSNWVVKTNL